jgi:hypothetical protein
MEENTHYNIKEILNYSDKGIISDKDINFNTFSQKDWNIYWTDEKMFSSKNLDIISPFLKIQRLPEMVYGYNRLVLVNEKKDFLFEISPIDMLDLSSFKERERFFTEKGKENDKEHSEANDKYKRIYYIPNELKVQYAEKWKTIKVDRDDIIKTEPTADWSYSSPYLGTISNITSHRIYLKSGKIIPNNDIKTHITDEEIPINRYIRI